MSTTAEFYLIHGTEDDDEMSAQETSIPEFSGSEPYKSDRPENVFAAPAEYFIGKLCRLGNGWMPVWLSNNIGQCVGYQNLDESSTYSIITNCIYDNGLYHFEVLITEYKDPWPDPAQTIKRNMKAVFAVMEKYVFDYVNLCKQTKEK